MHNNPSQTELAEAVLNFIQNIAAPNLSGREAFLARVAGNAMETLIRDLTYRETFDAQELESLLPLLGGDRESGIAALNADLCVKLRSGEMNCDTPGVLAHLRRVTRNQLAIDQPGYSGLKYDVGRNS